MVLISLPLVKIRGDAKADDDSDVGATIARKPFNAQLDCNIAPPFFFHKSELFLSSFH
jgi:hypothetical protein